MPALGILLAVIVDLALPVLAAVLLIRANHRNRSSDLAERRFWVGAGWYLGVLGFFVAFALVSTYSYVGGPVYFAVLLSFPLGLIPTSFNLIVLPQFFPGASWALIGYLPVLTVFLLGLVAWASLPLLGVRRLSQRDGRA